MIMLSTAPVTKIRSKYKYIYSLKHGFHKLTKHEGGLVKFITNPDSNQNLLRTPHFSYLGPSLDIQDDREGKERAITS
jgi:hypothetical protein